MNWLLTAAAQTDIGKGLNEIEAALNASVYIVTLVVWGFFLAGLRSENGGRRSFSAVLFLHFAPLPFAFLDSSPTEFWQFLRFGALGGLALIIGLPHYYWEPGQRARPRIIVAIVVVVTFALMILLGAPPERRTPWG